MKKQRLRLQFSFPDILFVILCAVVFIVASAVISALTEINVIVIALFMSAVFAAVSLTYVFYRKSLQARGHGKPLQFVEGALSASISEYEEPVLICPLDSEKILWRNRAVGNLPMGNSAAGFGEIFSFKSKEDEKEGLYSAGDRLFTCRIYHAGDNKEYNVYIMTDATDRIKTEIELSGKNAAVAYIVVDNIDELLNFEQDDYRVASSEADSLLRKWASTSGGIIKEYQNEKYIFIFEKSYLPQYSAAGFDILDKIREIRVGENRIPITVSVGVSDFGATIAEKEKNARSALDTALQRGGDQVVVRGDGTLEIYGGKMKVAQKRAKVKARAVANELVSHITNADNVLVMFHKFADFDAIGSACGIARLAMFCGVPVNIVRNVNDTGIKKSLEWIDGEEEYKSVFVDSATALDLVTTNTLLVVCDVSNVMQFESPELFKHCKNTVIIDHHRKTGEFENEPLITYIEPAASAASELVCEMLEQVLPTECLLPREADLMMAGILLDTNQFTKSTGTRTFSAALYLRSVGADLGEVQEFFKTDLNEFQRELRFHSNVEIYRDICAIAVAIGKCELQDKIPAAKAANRLLTVEGVKASFAIVPIDGEIHISARSSGTINVQLILEKLKGGGHFDAAGARMTDITVDEAEKMLKNAIDKYLEDMKKSDSNIK